MIFNIMFKIVAVTSKYIGTRRQKRWHRFRNIMNVNNNIMDIAEAERAYGMRRLTPTYSEGNTHNFGFELKISISEDVRLER